MPSQTALTHVSDAELGTAVAENLFAFFRSMAATLTGEIIESEQLSYHHTFPTSPMFKGAWGTRLADAEVDAAIEQTVAWWRARKAPFAFWWTGWAGEPGNLAQRLEAHGFALNIAGDPGMAAALADLPEVTPTPAGFEIVEASDHKRLEDWRDVFCAAYGVPLWAGQAWVDAALHGGIGKTPWRLFVGYLDNKPVATNILFNGAGVAGLYGISTLPEARGQGIGAAITLNPCLVARDQGYRYAVLFASEMGYRVYRRLGFRAANCQVGRYLWRNPGD